MGERSLHGRGIEVERANDDAERRSAVAECRDGQQTLRERHVDVQDHHISLLFVDDGKSGGSGGRLTDENGLGIVTFDHASHELTAVISGIDQHDATGRHGRGFVREHGDLEAC